jgi:hypothetical protein
MSAREWKLKYTQGDCESRRIYESTNLVEVVDGRAMIYIVATDSESGIIQLYLSVPPLDPTAAMSVDGLLEVTGLHSAPECYAVGRVVEATSSMEQIEGEYTFTGELVFRITHCRDGHPSTVRVESGPLELWPVVGLYDYVKPNEGTPRAFLEALDQWGSASAH